jgi:hypothetical protein
LPVWLCGGKYSFGGKEMRRDFMGRADLKSLLLEKARDPTKNGVIPAFEQAKQTNGVAHKAEIDLQFAKIGPAQAPNEDKIAATLPPQDAKHAADLSKLDVGVGEFFDFSAGIVLKREHEGVGSSVARGFRHCGGERPAACNDAKAAPGDGRICSGGSVALNW